MKKILSLVLLIIIVVSCCFAGCSEKTQISSTDEKMTLEYYNQKDKKIGVISGTIQEDVIREKLPNAEICLYNVLPDLVAALDSKNIDAFSCADANLIQLQRENPSITRIDEVLKEFDVAFAFAKNNKGEYLRDQFNEFLSNIKKNGILQEIYDDWINKDSSSKAVDTSMLKNNHETLKFVTTGTTPPFSFMVNQELSGYDVDLAVQFCRAYKYNIDMDTVDFSGIMTGVGSGKYDFAANCILVTEERKESVNFSDITCKMHVVLAVPAGENSGKNQSFFQSIASSFEKTFIREDRWQMILQGLLVTLIISLLSVICGSILGFLLMLIYRTRMKWLHTIVNIYIKILQGTPILVILMILFYIIFAETGLNNVFIAVIAFSLNFSAYVCEILRSGIDSVDKGQMEAALSLGYTKTQAFMSVVLPQAISQCLNVYRGQVITLIKNTSIVGYIAIMDLTKVSDFIRSRTYEPFFPLIVTAVIYFLICALIAFLLTKLDNKLKRKEKKKKKETDGRNEVKQND